MGLEIGAAEQLTDAITSVLAQIQADMGAFVKVRFFGRLIEAQRAALEAHGLPSFAVFEAPALSRFFLAQDAWRRTLEAEANQKAQVRLRPNDSPPEFSLPSSRGGRGDRVSLQDILAKKPRSWWKIKGTFTSPRRDHVAALAAHVEELNTLGVAVVVEAGSQRVLVLICTLLEDRQVSFCPDARTAQQWDEEPPEEKEVGSPFLHLWDPETPGVPGDAGESYLPGARKPLYVRVKQSWGFRKSYAGVWSPESLQFYSDQKLQGRELHPSNGQDPHRMGGDILLDGRGQVVLAHYSKSTRDRPSVEETLLPLLRGLPAPSSQPGDFWMPAALVTALLCILFQGYSWALCAVTVFSLYRLYQFWSFGDKGNSLLPSGRPRVVAPGHGFLAGERSSGKTLLSGVCQMPSRNLSKACAAKAADEVQFPTMTQVINGTFSNEELHERVHQIRVEHNEHEIRKRPQLFKPLAELAEPERRPWGLSCRISSKEPLGFLPRKGHGLAEGSFGAVGSMEVFLLYLGGIALGLLTIELLGTSCSACKQLICHKWQINQNPTPVVPDWIYTAATIGIAIGVVTLVVVFISHRRRVTRSKTYRTMVQAAEEHHMQCHAAIPNDSGVMHFTDSWKARPFHLRDIVRVSRLRVYDLNIVGVGFPLYNNAMLSFLQRGRKMRTQLGILFWLGNGISWGLFRVFALRSSHGGRPCGRVLTVRSGESQHPTSKMLGIERWEVYVSTLWIRSLYESVSCPSQLGRQRHLKAAAPGTDMSAPRFIADVIDGEVHIAASCGHSVTHLVCVPERVDVGDFVLHFTGAKRVARGWPRSSGADSFGVALHHSASHPHWAYAVGVHVAEMPLALTLSALGGVVPTGGEELTTYLQDACNKLPTRLLPEVVGVSIGFDFHNDVEFIQKELEDELMILGSGDSLGRPDRFGKFERESIREMMHEVREAWREGDRSGAGAEQPEVHVSSVVNLDDSSTEGSSNTDFDNSEQDSLNELVEESMNSALLSSANAEEVRKRLRAIKNSGRVVAVFRYPVNNKEAAANLQRALDQHPYDGQKLEVHLLPADPPSLLWEHFIMGLKTREQVCCFFCLSPRDLSLIKANLKILLCCSSLTLGYYMLYARVYRAQQRALEEDFMMTTLVTISASLGNLLINQIVWSCAMDVGYRLKADRDAYVFRWYTLITLINTLFNFGVITATFSKKPDDALQRVLYEAALGNQMLVFVRGSLVSYAIFPVFYGLLWLKGRVMLLWEYLSSTSREWAKLRFKAEQAFEPPEWWLQYDYAAIVVMMTTSCFCLFIHGSAAVWVFTLD
ncbi:unnamed protein product, partial [Symbiodinium sp. KB8]